MEESTPTPISALLERLAVTGDQASSTLASWGIKTVGDSRLAQASAFLREVAATGTIQPTMDAVLPVLRAIWVAADFADIAGYLPENRVKSVRQELSVAINGPLWPPPGQRQALQYQTQHWIGAVLFHAGLEIEHIPFSAKRQVKIPEFWIAAGLRPIGVEVKRPESVARLPVTVADAMEKFRNHACYGAIVLELSDCLTPGPEASLRGQGNSLMETVHQTVWDDPGNRYKPGFEKLIYVGGIVRGAWERPAEHSNRLRFFGHAFHQGYSPDPNSLQGIRSRWLQDFMNKAFSDVVWRMNDPTIARPIA